MIYIDGEEKLNLPEQVGKNKDDIEELKTKTGYVTYYRHHLELIDADDVGSSSAVIELDLVSKNKSITLENLYEELGTIPYVANGRVSNGQSVLAIKYDGTTYIKAYTIDDSFDVLVTNMFDYAKEI